MGYPEVSLKHYETELCVIQTRSGKHLIEEMRAT